MAVMGLGTKITETRMNSASIVHFAYMLIVLDEVACVLLLGEE